jgi:ABC-type nitrate/sulfonate/bicarbonate transport system permease component
MIIVIGILGFLCDWSFEVVRRMLLGWAAPVHDIAVGSA